MERFFSLLFSTLFPGEKADDRLTMLLQLFADCHRASTVPDELEPSLLPDDPDDRDLAPKCYVYLP